MRICRDRLRVSLHTSIHILPERISSMYSPEERGMISSPYSSTAGLRQVLRNVSTAVSSVPGSGASELWPCLYDRVLPLEDSTFAEPLAGCGEPHSARRRPSGRKRSDISLVAVTKKFSAEKIREAYEAGLRDFGENYVQEFADKHPQPRRSEGCPISSDRTSCNRTKRGSRASSFR